MTATEPGEAERHKYFLSHLSVSPPLSPAVLQQPGHGPAELEAGLGLVSLGFAGVDTGPDVSW